MERYDSRFLALRRGDQRARDGGRLLRGARQSGGETRPDGM